ncbi:MAG: acyltransferase family protein [Prosthecobacter sp.]
MASRANEEMKGLTGLRGIAALTVFVSHSQFEELMPVLKPVAAFLRWHDMAVDLFFMLSGFVLMHVYAARLGAGRKGGWREYFVARMARVYPLYLITFAATMGIFFAGSYILKKWPPYLTREAILINLPLAQNWPGLFEKSINLPAWSLSVEVVCYVAVMPILLLFHGRLSKPAALVLIVLLMGGRALLETQTHGWVALGRGLTCFVVGGLLQHFYDGALSSKSVAGIALLGAGLFLLLQSGVAWGGLALTWPLIAFPFLVLGLAAPVSSLAHRIFESGPMLWLGDISYSLYLWHSPVAMITYYQIRPRLSLANSAVHVAWMGVEIVFVLLLSYFSFRCLEMPLRTWCRKKLSPRSERIALPLAGS